jgi:tRNA(fMet)-specific endonuclease VapC
MFVLDTDFCIDWLRRKEYARKALASVLPSEVAVSAVTVGELLVGAYCAQMPGQETGKVLAFLKPIGVLEYGTAEATHFAGISAVLRRQGQLIGVPDAMIAATAEVDRSTVITKNLKHFQKVKDLKVVNWAVKPPKGASAR